MLELSAKEQEALDKLIEEVQKDFNILVEEYKPIIDKLSIEAEREIEKLLNKIKKQQ